jgi:hypothetical protein
MEIDCRLFYHLITALVKRERPYDLPTTLWQHTHHNLVRALLKTNSQAHIAQELPGSLPTNTLSKTIIDTRRINREILLGLTTRKIVKDGAVVAGVGRERDMALLGRGLALLVEPVKVLADAGGRGCDPAADKVGAGVADCEAGARAHVDADGGLAGFGGGGGGAEGCEGDS